MRVGVLIGGDLGQLAWADKLGFRSVEWMRFHDGSAGVDHPDWKPFAEQFAGEARARNIRISAIGALYRNPLDPAQTDFARATFRRAIEVAAHVGIQTVSGFAGAMIETELDERGGNLVYKPPENYLPQLLAFWEPLARFAADHGIRLAFENCPQGPYHLPVMGYNLLSRPAMWERFFDATHCENIGLEWDPSHLLCQLIDPVPTIHKFGPRIFHVHAKDALINRPLLQAYGICHPGVAEHRFPGLGEADWAQIIHALLRAGYDSDLNIEGWHDPVYRDHAQTPAPETFPAISKRLCGLRLEEPGLLIAKRILEQYTAGT